MAARANGGQGYSLRCESTSHQDNGLGIGFDSALDSGLDNGWGAGRLRL